MRAFVSCGLAAAFLVTACKKETASVVKDAELSGQVPPTAPAEPSQNGGTIPMCEEQVKGLGLLDGEFEPEFQDAGTPSQNDQLQTPPPPAPPSESASGRAPEKKEEKKAEIPRAGNMERQLAPSHFEKMSQCGEQMPDVSGFADGKINGDGDCEFPAAGGYKFVSCHYHLGIEFASSNTTSRPGFGEIHCIFPNDTGPTVWGGHFVCSNEGRKPAHVSHDKFANATCTKNILTKLKEQYDACSSKNCCDDGTLTGSLDKRKKKNKLIETVNRELGASLENGLPVRPDFRICGEPMKLNCDDLAMWTGHSANAPTFKADVETEKEFAPQFSPAAETAIAAEKAKLPKSDKPH